MNDTLFTFPVPIVQRPAPDTLLQLFQRLAFHSGYTLSKTLSRCIRAGHSMPVCQRVFDKPKYRPKAC